MAGRHPKGTGNRDEEVYKEKLNLILSWKTVCPRVVSDPDTGTKAIERMLKAMQHAKQRDSVRIAAHEPSVAEQRGKLQKKASCSYIW